MVVIAFTPRVLPRSTQKHGVLLYFAARAAPGDWPGDGGSLEDPATGHRGDGNRQCRFCSRGQGCPAPWRPKSPPECLQIGRACRDHRPGLPHAGPGRLVLRRAQQAVACCRCAAFAQAPACNPGVLTVLVASPIHQGRPRRGDGCIQACCRVSAPRSGDVLV